MRGTVYCFDKAKGWGFIRSDDEQDYFVHRSDLDRHCFRSLNRGERVEFEPCTTIKGISAANVRRL